MLTTKDLINELSKYPEDTEWEVLGNRLMASELGIIDVEPMKDNDFTVKLESN
jgi:hypothetical protein